MALNFFRQSDIEAMTPESVPQNFINYFNGLTEERKQAIITSNPLIAGVLGYNKETGSEELPVIEKEIVDEVDDNDDIYENSDLDDFSGYQEDDENGSIASDEDSQLEKNVYDDVDLESLNNKSLEPFVAFSIDDNIEKCPVHHCKFKNLQFKYQARSMRYEGTAIYGVTARYCPECHRLYIKNSYSLGLRERFETIGIDCVIYDKSASEKYIRRHITEIEMSDGQAIYYPDVWAEDRPICPVHNNELEKFPYVKKYKDREVHFTGWFCDKCNKVMIRRTAAADLEDQCATVGIPLDFEKIEPLKPLTEKKSIKNIHADYYVEYGKRSKYDFEFDADCYLLRKDDVLVVSDSTECNLEGHSTGESSLVMILVDEKRNGEKAYIVQAGYCSQCQKYYIEEDDFEVLYKAGRPEVTVIYDTDSEAEHSITSGEVFEIEKSHLDKLETELDTIVNDIKAQADYVNPYAVGDYDDGNLSFAKSISNSKYSGKISEVLKYKPKPYAYRVDLSNDNQSMIFYLGAADLILDDQKRVFSYNSDFGRKLVNYRTIEIEINGQKYDIKLQRQFDISEAKLYSYVNNRTDEDAIYRKGITDPFLIRVLNTRKRQHNLTDIIATIQENQNAIVDVPIDKNIIVQGCAGSGKTMVLLHRLSNLKYNHRDYDFEKAVILTPNENFNLHIKGLVGELQINDVDRISVEQYYLYLLSQFHVGFDMKRKITSEVMVKQNVVDYIYSDLFREDLKAAYFSILKEYEGIIENFYELTDLMGLERKIINTENPSNIVVQIKGTIDAYKGMISKKKDEIQSAEEDFKKLNDRKKFLEEQIPKSREAANGIIKQTVPGVYGKIGTAMSECQRIIDEQTQMYNEINEEVQQVQSRLLPFGKERRLTELKKKSDRTRQQILTQQAKMEELNRFFEDREIEKTDEESLAWMKQVQLAVPQVREDVRLCERIKDEASRFELELQELHPKVLESETACEKVKADAYSIDCEKACTFVEAVIERWTPESIFNKSLEKAVRTHFEGKTVKLPAGTHRYNLYSDLILAPMYFGKDSVDDKKLICIDEGQDMCPNEYKLIYKLNQGKCVFNIYGDTNQLLKPGRGISDWNMLVNEFNADKYELNENYRNTNQITRYCNDNFDMSVAQTGVDGVAVREIARKDLEDELSNLVVNDEKVAVLVPRKVRKGQYLSMDMLSAEVRDIIGSKIENGYISLMYVDEVKGIEFDTVFVDSAKMTRNEKYIAYTRALSKLVIVVDAEA